MAYVVPGLEKMVTMSRRRLCGTAADVTNLVGKFGYKADTPVQKGIERFIEWYEIYFNVKQ